MRALAPLVGLLVLLVLAAPAAAQTPPAEQRIALGVKAHGLDVGGLTLPEAAAKLQQTFGAALARNISVQVAGRRYRLTMKKAGLKFDTALTAKRAYYAGKSNPAADVPLAIEWDRARIEVLAARVSRAA